MTSDDRPDNAGDAFNHLWTDTEDKCWHCDEPTRWVELAFEAPLHPGPCTDAKYRELADADREAEKAVQEEWAKLPRGTRKEEFGQVYEWTGSVWRLVSRAELDAERWRNR